MKFFLFSRRTVLVLVCLALCAALAVGCSSWLRCHLQVKNDSATVKYIWLDGEFKGSLDIGQIVKWEIDKGSHTVRATMSSDFNDNPVEETFDVSAGETYYFTVYGS
jgi:hypothetical protein